MEQAMNWAVKTRKGWIPLGMGALMLLTGCPGTPREDEATRLQPVEGGKFRGGVLVYPEYSDFRSIFPPYTTEIVGARVVSAVYEGLVGLNPRSLEPEPRLAYRWEMDTTLTVYRFFIRKGVKFHDSEIFEGGKGRELTVQDIHFLFSFLCSGHPLNQMHTYLRGRIEGCEEFYQKTRGVDDVHQFPAEGVSGVQALNDSVIEIRLVRPLPFLLEILAMPSMYVFPRELLEKYGRDGVHDKAVGTGPFLIRQIARGDKIILERNPHYWRKDNDGNPLPYLYRVEIRIVREERTALLSFLRGDLDFLPRIPTENINEIVSPSYELLGDYVKYQLERTDLLSLHYYGFLTDRAPFQDERVRRAFCMAIDRKTLAEKVFGNILALPAEYGVVPPAFAFYNARDVQGCPYDPEQARKLLAEAGYPEGRGFPEITLYINKSGGRNVRIAELVQNMLRENLGITVRIHTSEWANHLNLVEGGKAEFFRLGWIADYPEPETFLQLFHGKHLQEGQPSYVNVTRYADARYDQMLDSALRIGDKFQRYEYYQQVDQYITDRTPIIPLLYGVGVYLLQPHIRGFEANAMELWDWSRVYRVPEES